MQRCRSTSSFIESNLQDYLGDSDTASLDDDAWDHAISKLSLYSYASELSAAGSLAAIYFILFLCRQHVVVLLMLTAIPFGCQSYPI